MGSWYSSEEPAPAPPQSAAVLEARIKKLKKLVKDAEALESTADAENIKGVILDLQNELRSIRCAEIQEQVNDVVSGKYDEVSPKHTVP